MSRMILPGSTLGVLGSGQLGRMFAIAARRLGYRVHVLSPDDDTPTGQVADVEIKAPYEDLETVAEFARRVEVVTFEFENVPAATTETAAKFAPVRPEGRVLHTTQNRLREKTFLRESGLPVTPFLPVRTAADLPAAFAASSSKRVLKTAAWGYDGKGQRVVADLAGAEAAWTAFGQQECILEEFIPFSCELSVVAARGLDGEFVAYGPLLNQHEHHILNATCLPAGLDPKLEQEAVALARAVLEQLNVVGVLCVEYFLTTAGQLLINELAPRPHNSGHLTIDACVTCQFEQQVRAVCGLPLGSGRLRSPSAMVNLLGDLWQPQPPAWDRALGFPEVKLHLYGKREARPGRKMGHLTAISETSPAALERALAARKALQE